MATTLYRKNGSEIESVKIDSQFVQQHINAGWQGSNDWLSDSPVVAVDPKDLSNLQVREAAKEAGIEGYDTRHIKTLQGDLDDNESRAR